MAAGGFNLEMNIGVLNEKKLVSVIIPTHNRKEWLVEALISVFNQTYKPIEVIVVDDGSSENICEHIKEQLPDKDILVIRNKYPTGAGAARNLGVSLSSGEYLSFLDSDDLWLADKLEKQVAILDSDAEQKIGFVGAGCNYMSANGASILKPSYPPKQATYNDFVFKIKMPGSGSNNLIRRSAFNLVGGFREDLKRGQDKHLWLKLLKRYEVAYCNEILTTVRIHDTDRVGINEDVVLSCRLKIDSEIEDRIIRRKAFSFTYYVMFCRLWGKDNLLAIKYLATSFVIYPFSIAPDISRIKGVAYKMMNL